MSQYIKKLQTGGTVDTQEVEDPKFKTATADYDARQLAADYEHNILAYAKHLGLKPGSKKYDEYITEAANIQKGIMDGTFSRGEGLVYTGSIIGDNNPMQSYALGLLDKVIAQKTKSAQETASEAKTQADFDPALLKNYFYKKFFGGQSTPDLQSWLDRDAVDEEGKRGSFNRMTAFADMLDSYADSFEGSNYNWSNSAYLNKDDYQKKLRDVAVSLRNGVYDNDIAAKLDTIGIGAQLREYLFGSGKKLDDAPAEGSYEALLAAKKKELDADVKAGILTEEEANQKLKEFADDYKYSKYGDMQWDRDYQNWANTNWAWTGEINQQIGTLGPGALDDSKLLIWNGNPGTSEADKTKSWLSSATNAQYAANLMNQLYAGRMIDLNGGFDRLTNSDIVRGVLATLSSQSDKVTPINQEEIYLNDSINYEKGTALKYNVKNGAFSLVHVHRTDTPVLYGILKSQYLKIHPQRSTSDKTRWAKDGAKLILKALTGAELQAIGQQQNQVNDYIRHQQYEQEAQQKNISVERVMAGKGNAANDTSMAHNLRSAGTWTDIASAGVSFVPVVGNVVAPILGLGATGMHMVADMLDPTVTRTEAGTNLAINLGLTALMLIPGGGAGKAAKAVKLGKGALQTAMVGYGAFNTASNLDRMKELRQKAEAGTLSAEERKELDYMYSMAAGTVVGVKGLAGQGAKALGNNFFGKAAALASDPLLAVKSLYSKNAKQSFTNLTKPLTAANTEVTKGEGKKTYWINPDGEQIEITASQKKNMLNTLQQLQKEKVTDVDVINKRLGEAWAKSGENGAWYSKDKTTQPGIKWDNESFNKNEWLKVTSPDDVSGELKITVRGADGNDVELAFTEAQQKELIKAYNDSHTTDVKNKAMQEITGDNTKKYSAVEYNRLTPDQKSDFDSRMAEIGLKAARDKYETFEVAKSKTIDGEINPNAVQIAESDAKTGLTRFNNSKISTHFSDIDHPDLITQQGAYDINTPIGKQNALARIRARRVDEAAAGPLGSMLLAAGFNTNNEMFSGLGAFGGRSATRKMSKVLNEKKQLRQQQLKAEANPWMKEAYEQALNRKIKSIEAEAAKNGKTLTDQDKAKIYLSDAERSQAIETYLERQQVLKDAFDQGKTFDIDPETGDFDVSNPISINKTKRSVVNDLIRKGFDKDSSLRKYNVDQLEQLTGRFRRALPDGTKLSYAESQNLLDGMYRQYVADESAAGRVPMDLSAFIDDLQVRNINESGMLHSVKVKDPLTGTEISPSELKTKYAIDVFDELKSEAARKGVSIADSDLIEITRKMLSDSDALDNVQKKIQGDVTSYVEAELNAKKTSLTTDLLDEFKAAHDKWVAENPTEAADNLKNLAKQNEIFTEINKRNIGANGEAMVDNISTTQGIAREKARANIIESARRNGITGTDNEIFTELDKNPYKKQLVENDLNAKYTAQLQATADKLSEISSLEGSLSRRDRENYNNWLAKNFAKRGDLDAKLDFLKSISVSGDNKTLLNKMRKDLPTGATDKEGFDIITRAAKRIGLDTSDESHLRLMLGDPDAEANLRKTIQIERRIDLLKRAGYDETTSAALKNAMENSGSFDQQIKDLDAQINVYSRRLPNAVIDKLKNQKQLTKAQLHFIERNAGITISDPAKAKAELKKIKFEEIDESKWIDTIKAAQKKAGFRNGGILDKMMFLRTGGEIKKKVLKAEEGLVVPKDFNYDWYKNLYKQTALLNSELKDHNNFAGDNLRGNNHNQNFDLAMSAYKNQAYTSDHDATERDIQDFYNSDYGQSSLEDFVNQYNENAAKIRGTWGVGKDGTLSNTTHSANTEYGLGEHNRLFRKMFASRSNNAANTPVYNIGYQDGKTASGHDMDDIMGTSTWMRRMDRREKEWSDNLTDEEKKARTFKITLGNGEVGYVYKKANGDIAILNPSQVEDIAQTPEAPQAQKKEESFRLDGDVEGSNYGLYTTPKDKFKKGISAVSGMISEHAPDFMALGRYLSNKKNNKRILDQMMRIRTSQLSPMDQHMYVRTGFPLDQAANQQAAQIQSQAGRAKSSDASLNNAVALEAADKAAALRQQGNLKSADVMYTTAKEQQALDRQVAAYNLNVKDKNAAALTNLHNELTRYKAGELSSQQTNLNTYLTELEKRRREEDLMKQKYREAFMSQKQDIEMSMELENDPEYKRLYDAFKTTSPGTDAYSNAYNALLEYKRHFTLSHSIDNLNEWAKSKKLRDRINVSTNSDYVPDIISARKGRKIDDSEIKAQEKDNDRIVKQILENIKNNQKALDRLSRSELLAIKSFLK